MGTPPVDPVDGRRRTAFLSMSVRPWGLLGATAALVAMATTGGFLGCLWWPLDLMAHFRIQYALGSTLLTVLYLLGRRSRSAAAAFVLTAINGSLLAPFYLPRADATPHVGPQVRVLLVNVNTHQGDPARVSAYVRRLDPDVLVLEEVSRAWVSALADIDARLPHSLVEPQSDNFGIGIWCRTKPSRAEVVYLGQAGAASVVSELPVDGSTLGLLATHAVPPGDAESASLRDEQLSEVARFLAGQRVPYVLVGDLNATPWSCAYRRLVGDAGLTSAMRGRGLAPTWPALPWPLRIPIDHGLHTRGVRVLELRVGPDVGSDHLPLELTVGMAAGGVGRP